MDFDDASYQCQQTHNAHIQAGGRLRRGQFYVNFFALHRPDLVNAVIGTDKDPFYDNFRIPAFLDYLKNNW